MRLVLLLIIYLAFISLGLPDAMLGSAWPVMQPELGAPLEMAGYLYMVIAAGTIVSSLFSGKLLKRFGTGKVTIVSVLMTAAALLGFSYAPSVIWLVLGAIPLGLGAGAVDAGLNDFVAIHYEAHHMSWLHCFWGVGATLSPIIMSRYIAVGNMWRNGYLTVSLLQFALVAVLCFSLPLWQQAARNNIPEETMDDNETVKNPLQIPGVKLAMFTFFFYCGVEQSVGLWGSSYLVSVKGVEAAVAAQWVSYYFAGITLGRLITGFVTFRMSNKHLVRLGQSIALLGTLLLFLPLPNVFSQLGLVTIGLGLAPIYPCMLHETPVRFGKEHSQTVIGYQMAFAYTGTTLLPPLLGFLGSNFSMTIFPLGLLLLAVVMFLNTERLNSLMKERCLTRQSQAN